MAEVGPKSPAQVLRAIAHPVRLQIYEYLETHGPATLTTLQAHVGGATGSLSYHLRQLFEHGFVQEIEGKSTDGRERWWAAISGGVNWNDADLTDDESRSAAKALQSVLLARQLDKLAQWREHGSDWGPEWTGAAIGWDSLLQLDIDEFRAFGAELTELIRRWSVVGRAPKPSDCEQPAVRADPTSGGRADVFLMVHTFPFDKPVP